MGFLKNLRGKDKSRPAAPINPGYDVLPSDLSTFRGPTELPEVEHKVSKEGSTWGIASDTRPWPYIQSSSPNHSLVRLPQPDAPSEPISLPARPYDNLQHSIDLCAPYSSVGSHDSAGNARIPDEDLLEPAPDAETETELENFASSPPPMLGSLTQEQKRRRRRENHGMAIRDKINESIQRLASLAPKFIYRDEPKGLPKGAILEHAVYWTRDLMWALHLKTQRESTLKDVIRSLGGSPFMLDTTDSPDNVYESVVEKEVQTAIDTNNITSFSSAHKSFQHERRASEPFKKNSIYQRKPHEHRPPRRLHKVTSRGSIISYVASVHSVTSLTYRSPNGGIETETREENSNLSYFPNQLKQDQSWDDCKRDLNDNNNGQDFLIPNSSAKESTRLMAPLTNEGIESSIGDDSPAPQAGIGPQILGEMKENDAKSTKESTRKADPAAEDPSKVDDECSFPDSVVAVNFEQADKDHDATSLARNSGQEASDIKTESFAAENTELKDLVKISDSGVDQDDTRHDDRDANDVQHANYSVVYLDNGLVRLRWTCVGIVLNFSETSVLIQFLTRYVNIHSKSMFLNIKREQLSRQSASWLMVLMQTKVALI